MRLAVDDLVVQNRNHELTKFPASALTMRLTKYIGGICLLLNRKKCANISSNRWKWNTSLQTHANSTSANSYQKRTVKKLISLNCLDFPIQFPNCFHVFGNLCPGYRISGQLSPFKSHQVPCFSCKFSRKHIQHLEKADPNWHVQTFPKQWCKIKNIFVFFFLRRISTPKKRRFNVHFHTNNELKKRLQKINWWWQS